MANTEKLKVLLISKNTPYAVKLRDKLKANRRYELRFEETAESAMTHIINEKLNSIIFNLDHFGPPQVSLVKNIQEVANVIQILVLSEEAEPESLQAIKDSKNLIVVEKKGMDLERDLVGLCERLISGSKELYFREAPRLPTNQKAVAEIIEAGRHYDCLLKDVSEKGACIELGTGRLKIGDKLKIIIQLEKLNRQRIVFAEVRWVKSQPGKGVAGLRFLLDEKGTSKK